MALDLVAGPFVLQTLEAVAVTDLAINAFHAFYDDAVGLCAYSATMGGLCVIQLDGTVCLRGQQNRANVIATDLQRPKGFLIHDSQFEYSIRLLDKYSMTGAVDALLTSVTVNHVDGIHVRCADRFLKVTATKVQTRPLDLATGWVDEYAFTKTTSGGTYQTVCRSAKSNILVISHESGEILFYDHILKTQLSLHFYVGANIGVWYSPKYNVYLVATSDHKLKIFSGDVAPNALSAVTVDTPLTQGHVSKIRCKVTGASGELCVGELLAWSITGAGTLESTQSITDSSGYATNKCIVAPNATLAAAIDITAELSF